jgi:hypothetical protein
MIQRSFDAGALADLTTDDLARLRKGISAHSTRVGLNQDQFASGEDLAGIMDALRWKSLLMPPVSNRIWRQSRGQPDASWRSFVSCSGVCVERIADSFEP